VKADVERKIEEIEASSKEKEHEQKEKTLNKRYKLIKFLGLLLRWFWKRKAHFMGWADRAAKGTKAPDSSLEGTRCCGSEESACGRPEDRNRQVARRHYLCRGLFAVSSVFWF
jgi:hypothetical protein